MKKFILFLSFLWTFNLLAQTNSEIEKARIIEETVELIVQDGDISDADFTTLFDELDSYFDNPININTATLNQLTDLRLLNQLQIAEFLRYRKQYGNILSYFELIQIDGWDEKTIKTILPFVVFEAPEKEYKFTVKKALKYGRSELIIRNFRNLEQTDAYTTNSDALLADNKQYYGSPDRLYLRYRYKYRKNLSLGITAEKDPGEAIFGPSQPNGFDFYSFHFQLKDVGFIKNLIVGDYQFQAGQGLTFWSGFGTRKSPFNPTQTKRYERGLVPYTASEENTFLRGGAAEFGSEKFSGMVFYSQKPVDANASIATDSLESEFGFSSLLTSGLHRTANEVANKDFVTENVIGGRLKGIVGKLRLGATAAQINYGGNFSPNLQLYQSLQNTSNSWLNLGADFDLVLNHTNFFGEISRSNNGAVAYLTGFSGYLNERFTVNMFYRDYPVNFQSRTSNAFGEKSSNYNEKGLYTAVDFKPVKKISIGAYYDSYRMPWLSFQKDAPTTGAEFGSNLIYRFNRKNSLTLMYRTETDEENNFTETLTQLSEETLSQYRAQFDYVISKKLRMRTRIELRKFEKNEEISNGFMIYQDVYFDFSEKLEFKTRVALFETDNYDTRIYAYENDMRYQFTVPAYSGQGMRTYILINYKIFEKIQLSVRYAQTYYTAERTFGSGTDSYTGNIRSEVKAQLIAKF